MGSEAIERRLKGLREARGEVDDYRVSATSRRRACRRRPVAASESSDREEQGVCIRPTHEAIISGAQAP